MNSVSVAHSFEHALGNLFRFTPKHSISQCKVCHDQQVKKGNHLNAQLPLSYQHVVPTSASRVSMAVSLRPCPDEAHLDRVRELFETFECTVNRTFFNHGTHLPPTRSLVQDELAKLAQIVRPHEHFFFYLDTPAILDGEDLLELLQKFESNANVWILLDFDSRQFLPLSTTYRFDTKQQSVKVVTDERSETCWANIFAFSGDQEILGLLIRTLHASRHRACLLTILRNSQTCEKDTCKNEAAPEPEDQNQIYLSTDRRANIRKIFFGFG
jgi:hypothetical protein